MSDLGSTNVQNFKFIKTGSVENKKNTRAGCFEILFSCWNNEQCILASKIHAVARWLCQCIYRGYMGSILNNKFSAWRRAVVILANSCLPLYLTAISDCPPLHPSGPPYRTPLSPAVFIPFIYLLSPWIHDHPEFVILSPASFFHFRFILLTAVIHHVGVEASKAHRTQSTVTGRFE